MNEVKRLKDHIEQFENHNPGETARVKGDDDKIYYHADFAFLLSDKIAKKEIQLQSERVARIAAETKLAELEDALKAKLEDCENSIDSLQREPSKLEAYKILKSRRNLYEEIIELVEKARSKS